MPRAIFVHCPEAEANERFAANQGLILSALNKFLGTGRQRQFNLWLLDGPEAAVQEATIALWRAARCYRPGGVAVFSTYYFRAAHNHLLHVCQRRCNRALRTQQQPELFDCPDRPHPRDGVYEECSEVLAKLSPQDRRVLCLRFLEGLRLTDVATRLGCLRKAGWARIQAALRRARMAAGVSE